MTANFIGIMGFLIFISFVTLIGILTSVSPNPQPLYRICFNAQEGVGVVPAYTPYPASDNTLDLNGGIPVLVLPVPLTLL